VQRAIARFGEPASLAASALVFTLDGVPMLYNGMEVGDTTESGAPALFEKLPIFWSIAERRQEFPRFYKQIMALRRSSTALRRGSLEWVRNSDEARVVAMVGDGRGERFSRYCIAEGTEYGGEEQGSVFVGTFRLRPRERLLCLSDGPATEV